MYSRATKAELWVFTLVALFLSGGPTALYVKATGYNPPAPEVALLLPILCAMLVSVMLRMRATLTGLIAGLPWVGVACLAVLSVAWSVSLGDTARESGVMLITVVYLGMFAGIADWTDILVRLWWVCVGLMVLSLLLYVGMPSLGRMQDVYAGALTGPWYEKNATGQFFLWSGLVNLALFFARPQRLFVAAIWAIVIGVALILTESTTSLLAYAVIIGMSAIVAVLRRSFVISLPVGFLMLCAVVPLLMLITLQADTILEGLGKSGTLTGRLPVWEYVSEFALTQRPVLGHGFAAFWAQDYEFTQRALIFDAVGYRVNHSHNAFLEARLDLGWPGAILWAGALVQLVLMSLVRLRATSGAYFAVPYAFAMPLIAFVEASPFGINGLTGFLFVLALAKITLTPSRTDRVSGAWRFLRDMGARAPTAWHGPGPQAVIRSAPV